MNPFLLAPQLRLASWKEFRKSLVGLSESDQLNHVVEYWSKAPLDKHAYDLGDPDLPSPWEMVCHGDWCRNSVAIGMEFTLRLAGWDADRLQLIQIRDWDVSEMITFLFIDERLVLNYSYGEITLYPTSRHDILGVWQFCGKFYLQRDY